MQIITVPLTAPAYLRAYIREPDTNTGQEVYPAVIIVPGGGYTHIPEAQAETLALAFAARGFQAFYLRYHFTAEKSPLLPQPMFDLAAAISQIRQHAHQWHLDPNKITAAGFSVGGHIVSVYNGSWQSEPLQAVAPTAELKLNAAILGYPVIRLDAGWPPTAEKLAALTSQPEKLAADQLVNAACAPTFIWHTADDPLVPVQNSLLYINALAQHKVPFDAHIFHHGPHGLALADPQTAWQPDADQPHVAHWLDLAVEWLHEIW
ncbi:alpha/beta hydrolase [Loigolactobacillus zhaoyuanensis]|uniref:alpha/beta hydrolase n=1 Tax=Loigolactobacillus zhaoyuanensis TaxID=2486017 RepID=UPI000F748989|nr:alpha/beta hydrolase [Loigolactobacillus zhaoyuanensis]